MKTSSIKPGDAFEGPSKTITDAHFLFFSGITGDVHPIHYDIEYAKTKRFERPIAHGLFLASLTALGATPAGHQLEGFVMVEQGCNFAKPVMVGDTIRPKIVMERAWQDGKRRFCRFKTFLTNQRGETVLEGYHIYQVLDASCTVAGEPT
jgi:acyl dehydratase